MNPAKHLPHISPELSEAGRRRRRLLFGMLALGAATPVPASTVGDDMAEPLAAVPLAAEFARDVSPVLHLPTDAIARYAELLQGTLESAQVVLDEVQYLVLVDRCPNVQAALVFWGATGRGWRLAGAAPVSSGLPGRYEHFLTPLGVFEHSLKNPDFRAEGTKNKLGFRGYGAKGLRIYDFGWVKASRGWGNDAMGELRFQMHATDPVLAASRLGSPQSEGCVRIPATLNAFIDHHGILDAEYERAVARGSHLWLLRPDREPTPTPGSYLVVVDSELAQRPSWSPAPGRH